jgi:hypothetical protein
MLEESLAEFKRLGNKVGLAETTQHLATVKQTRGETASARLVERAHAARRLIDEQRADAAWERGSRMTLGEAADYALETTAPQ